MSRHDEMLKLARMLSVTDGGGGQELAKLFLNEYGDNGWQPGQVERIRNPKLPRYLFEWHPQVKKIYYIYEPTDEEVAEAAAVGKTLKVEGCVLAEHCLNTGQFYGFVQTFCRGIHEAERLAGCIQLIGGSHGVGQAGI